MDTITETQRIIDMNAAVQNVIPFGITRGQIDRMVNLVRSSEPIRDVAFVLDPHLLRGNSDSRDETIAIAGAVRAAVRDQDQQPGPLSPTPFA